MNKLNLIIFIIEILLSLDQIKSESTTSFDSLISSQCKAKCLSLYPWKFDDSSSSNTGLSKRSLSIWNETKDEDGLGKKKRLRHNNENKNAHGHSNSIIWHRVMEKCTKNQNCLQCSLPCDIPTNLLQNCKYLCKQRHPLCIESCNLMIKLNEEKYGTCPNVAKVSREINTSNKCNNYTKSLAISALLRNNPDLSTIELSTEDSNKPVINECSKDSDCADISKCCSLNPECPEHGNVCQKPLINNLNLPSIPFNLTITERKKGKTIILSWDCIYNKNKPTMFVVEGRWSLKSPSGSSNSNDNFMTKWGYLAQTVNTNSVILRSVNRGRWYKFRVASISKSGTYGYSQPTELFILSSPPKPASQPQNLTVNQVYISDSESNKVDADLSWLPSKRSDLPITNYKINWQLRSNNEPNQSVQLSNYKQEVIVNDYDSDEDSSSSFDSVNEKFEKRTLLNTPESGSDLIDAQSANKYTIKSLLKNSNYVVELVAQSKYEDKILSSSPIRVKLSTHNYVGQEKSLPYTSLHLKSDKVEQEQLLPEPAKSGFNTNHNDYDDEDDDMDINKSQQQIRESLPTILESKRPIIKNLTVQVPYFQNGLVKAKLSWQIEQEESELSSSQSSRQEASINSKTLIDQPMFTISWFPMKCIKYINNQEETEITQLPTPITATTINTHFEIYELKYNCDYVVNIKLANQNRNVVIPGTSISSSSIIQKNNMPPQVASAQFKVPSCALIKVVGRISPICYERNLIPDLFKLNEPSTSSTTESSSTAKSTSSTRYQTKIIDSLDKDSLYNLLYSSTIRPKLNQEIPSVQLSTLQHQHAVHLPRVYNIRYKIVDRTVNRNFYSVEFSWSVPGSLKKEHFNGYQISVVPKAIPGFSSYQDTNDSGYIGSIGAIVSKEQQSFIVRQLRPSVRYIFQIQTIGRDDQTYGPPNSLEFMIESEPDERSKTLLSNGNQKQNEKINRIDYDLINLDQMKSDTDSSSSLQSSSPSNLNNGSSSTCYLSFKNLFTKSVFFILINLILNNERLFV